VAELVQLFSQQLVLCVIGFSGTRPYLFVQIIPGVDGMSSTPVL
jgi:hypothetical protein